MAGFDPFTEVLPPEVEPESWLRRLHAGAAEQTRAPAPALWNSPALVVTGAMASRALCAALDHEADYPAETIVMQEADVGENEAAAMFEEVTGLGDGGVLNVNRRHVESVTLTLDAPVGPAERHNTVLRTLPPIAVAAAHSTAPHAAGGERGHARRARPTPR